MLCLYILSLNNHVDVKSAIVELAKIYMLNKNVTNEKITEKIQQEKK